MNSRRLVAVSGKMYSGKDTFAAVFLEVAGPGWRRVGFADALKQEAAELMGLSVAEIEAQKAVYRPLLIEIGQRRRLEDPDYWIKQTLQQPGNLIIPDLRFPNEMARLLDAQATLVRLEAKPMTRAHRGQLHEDKETETQLDAVEHWDYVLHNDYASVAAFRSKALEVSAAILGLPSHAYS